MLSGATRGGAVLAVWLCGMGLCFLGGAAQGEPPPVYETVVRGNRFEQGPAADDPAGFSTRIRILEPPPGMALTDVLESAPGLRLRDSGGRQTLGLRGSDGQQLAVFLDGIRLTPAGGGPVDLTLLDPTHLELAEVRRGAGSARFGSSAIGGALLLQTPRLRTRNHTRVGLGYGSSNTWSGSAAHADKAMGLRYLASASYRQSDGDFTYTDENGEARQRQNNASRGGELLLKADRPLGGDRWLLLVLDDFGATERGAPGMSQRPSATAGQRDVRNLASVRLRRFDTLVPGGRLEVGLAQRFQHFSFREPSPPAVDSQNQSYGLEGTVGLGLPLGGSGRLDAGVELRGELFRDASVVGDPWRLETDLWMASSLRLLRRHLVLVPAVRLAVANGFGSTVVPRFGMVVRPLRWTRRRWLAPLELVANLGRSFRYPSFQEMYIRLDGFGANPTLQPEDALEGEVGLRWRRRLLSLEAVYFQRRLKNLILFAPVSSFLVRADNYRDAHADGLEAAGELHAPGGLSLRASYTFTRSRFGEPSLPLPGHPGHRVKARLEWEPPWPARLPERRRFQLRLFTAVVGESATTLDRFGSQVEEGRVLLSAGGSLGYRGFVLGAEGWNLLDKRDAVDAVGFPLPPARFMVSLAKSL